MVPRIEKIPREVILTGALVLFALFAPVGDTGGHQTAAVPEPSGFEAFPSYDPPTATPRVWIASWAGPTDNITRVSPTATPTAKPTPKAKPQPKPTARPKLAGGPYKPWREFNNNVMAARKYAQSVLSATSWRCLDVLFDRESRWRVHAGNRLSGAYGIPQALPGSKMAWAGDDWRDNATTQVKWGIHYIKGSYGNPCIALDHSYRTGWY